MTGGDNAAWRSHPGHVELRFDLRRDLLATASPEGWLTSLNATWERLLGWTRDELMSRPLALGMKTVAEGVEDRTTYELLRDYEIDRMQGFVVGKPTPLLAEAG